MSMCHGVVRRLRRFAPRPLWAFAFLLAGTAPAFADPITAAVASFIGFLGSGTVAAAITRIAIGVGLSLLFQKKPAKPVGGLSGTVATGGVVPRSFVIGRRVVDGSLVYRNSFGASGGTPNARYVRVIALADLPDHALAGIVVNSGAVTWNPEATPETEGIAIPEYTVGGKAHLWVRYYDGTQTTADSRLVSLFGSDPERPYTSRRIGTGCPYVVMTALLNPELFPEGWPSFRFVLDGPPVYDRRFDDTAGGEGAQRLATPSTWARSRNPIVNIAAIIRGFRRAGAWVWGGQTTSEAQLPSASLFAAANECDAAVALKGGGTEPAYEAGLEIRFSDEPADAIERLLDACGGRIAEIGGRYKFRVGAAGAAVFAFSDGDILSSEGQTYDPFPSLAPGATVNAIHARYISVPENWAEKDAKLLEAELEAADDGRRHPDDLNLIAVTSGTQAQRLMKQRLAWHRAWRRHVLPMPPDAQVLEPLDTVAFTSTRNGYDGKSFDIERCRDLPDLNVIFGLKEEDPSGVDWDPDTDELPITHAPPIAIGAAPPQPMSGWSVEPFVDQGRPSFRVYFAAGMEDVRAVHILARRASDEAIVFDGEAPYDPDEGDDLNPPSRLPNKAFSRNLDLEVSGRFVPISARSTERSAWLAVTTPDVGITEAELDAGMQALFGQLKSSSQAWVGHIREAAIEAIENMAAANGGAYAFNEHQINLVASIIGHRVGENEAQIIRADRAIATINSALAEALVNLIATTEDGSAEVLWAMRAAALPEGAIAAVEETLRAGFGGQLAEAARGMEVYAGEGGAFSRLWFRGDRFDIIDGQGVRRNALLFPVQDVPRDAPITVEGSDNIIRANLTGRQIRHFTLMDASATMRAAHGLVSLDYLHDVKRSGAGHTLSWGPEFVAPLPTGVSTLDGAVNQFAISVKSTNPVRKHARYLGSYTETPTVAFRAFRQQTTGSTSQQLTTTPIGLNYVPGNAILAISIQHRRSTASPVQGGQVVAANTVEGWSPIDAAYGGHSSGGGQFRAIGVRAFLRFADGNEGAFQPFEHSGGGTFFTELTTHYYALDFLGGTLSLCDDPTANAGSTDGSTWNHTIKTDGFNPAIAFSVAAIANQSGTEPDQAFSETPDQNRTTFAFGLGNFWINVRSKVKFFNTEADDVTTSLTAPGGTGVRSLISFGLKME